MRDDEGVISLTVADLDLIAEALGHYARDCAAEAGRLANLSNDEELPVFERARAIVEASDSRCSAGRADELSKWAQQLADRAAFRAHR